MAMVLISSSTWAGNCQCPDDHMKNGRICGKTSAFCKPGGEEPTCGAKNEKEAKELYLKKCVKSYKK